MNKYVMDLVDCNYDGCNIYITEFDNHYYFINERLIMKINKVNYNVYTLFEDDWKFDINIKR